MAEDNNNSIETMGGNKQQGKQQGGRKKGQKTAQQIKKIVSKLKKLPIILPAGGIILLIVLIVGLLSSFLSMPGMILENLKQAALSAWNNFLSFFDGNHVDRMIDEEDEIELAQRINAMGYDIVGSGFTDVTEYNEDGAPTKLGQFSDGRNYLRAYLISNEITYTIAQWSVAGSWQAFWSFSGVTAGEYSQGMLNLIDIPEDEEIISKSITIDRESESMKIEPTWFDSFSYGTFYFDLSTWTARYGKPVELMLALHLATMMPDLTYDLCTLNEFDTKIDIATSDVEVNFEDVQYNGISIPTSVDDTTDDDGNVIKGAKTILEENDIDLSDEEIQALVDLRNTGTDKTSWPRIINVRRHWFYNDFSFTYGKGNQTLKVEMAYTPLDDSDKLKDIADGIKIKASMPDSFYQLCDPQPTGPNNNIVRLFKGDENDPDRFPGKYYQFDGTKERAKQIAEAKARDKANEEGKDITEATYTFGGQEYPVENVTIQKEPVNFKVDTTMPNGTQLQSTKNAFAAFSILEGMNSDASEKIYRNLQELLISLDYFKEEDFQKVGTQVLEWILPNHMPAMWPVREENEYGAFIRSKSNLKDGFESGESVISPADATIVEIGDNSIKLKLKEVDDNTLQQLQKELGTDTNIVLDGKCILDMEFLIKGISVNNSLTVSQDIKRGDDIGTTTSEDIQVIMYNIDKSVVDNIDDYMEPDYGNVTNPGPWYDPDYEVKVEQMQKDIYKKLKSYKLTDAACFAVLGVMQAESSFILTNENPLDQGFGLLQWTNTNEDGSGRRDNLEAFCAQHGYAVDSIEGQLEFFIYELEESYSQKNGYTYPVYETLMTSNDMQECLEMFFCHAEAGYDVPISSNYEYALGYNTQYLFDQRLTYATAFSKKRGELAS